MSDTLLADRSTTYPVVPESDLLPLRGDPITGDRYYSRDFMEREWDHMWTRIWHIAGRARRNRGAGRLSRPRLHARDA